MTTGQLIRKAREAKGLSQVALDRAIGTHSQASKWERDEATPTIYNLKRIAAVLGVSMESLTGREDRPDVPPVRGGRVVGGR